MRRIAEPISVQNLSGPGIDSLVEDSTRWVYNAAQNKWYATPSAEQKAFIVKMVQAIVEYFSQDMGVAAPSLIEIPSRLPDYDDIAKESKHSTFAETSSTTRSLSAQTALLAEVGLSTDAC